VEIDAMRGLDAGSTAGWNRAEIPTEPETAWNAGAENGAPGGIGLSRHWPALDDTRRIAELERKICQLTRENDFLKKRYGISGIITRRPSSVARMPV
jgi:hypothetical protein